MYQKIKTTSKKLGKTVMVAVTAMFIVSAANAQKPKLAVMDFMAGVGLYQNDVNGLSDMLINSLFNTGRFELIERGQLSELIGETNLQKSSLSAGQLQQLAIKGVNFLLLGTVNLTGGEYNIDVRVVDVGTGQLYSTAGVTKLSGQTYRDMMPKLANELATKLPQIVTAAVTITPVTVTPIPKKYSIDELEAIGFRFRTYNYEGSIKLNECKILSGDVSNGLVLFTDNKGQHNQNYLAYFVNGKFAYPILKIYTNDPEMILIGIEEGVYSYGCVNLYKWNSVEDRPMCKKLREIFGNSIFTNTFIYDFRDGTINIKLLEKNFHDFISSGKTIDCWK
ncbi:MAG: CsgG/HfaB family protein [Prevotellaceae bacterium]|jgi:TolB-like protein|nr:CsgG/HfaB family protein [Prevotellaceae bacterium]